MLVVDANTIDKTKIRRPIVFIVGLHLFWLTTRLRMIPNKSRDRLRTDIHFGLKILFMIKSYAVLSKKHRAKSVIDAPAISPRPEKIGPQPICRDESYPNFNLFRI